MSKSDPVEDDFFSFFKFEDEDMNELLNENINDKNLNESGANGVDGDQANSKEKIESILNQEEVAHLDQQPLAVGYYVSTARCGPLPKWLRGDVSLESNFHTFKVKLRLKKSYTGSVEQLVRQADGSIISRAEVTWTAHPQGYVRDGGSIVMRWRRVGSDWLYAAPVSGSSLKAYTGALEVGAAVAIEVQAVNGAGAAGPWVSAPLVVVQGKAAPPANATSVAATQVPGGVLVTWALNTEADYLDTEIRAGATWAGGTLAWRGTADRYLLPWPAAGALTLWIAHRDTSQNYSASPVSVALTVGNAALVAAPQIVANAVTQVFESYTAGPVDRSNLG